jgi:hypothetical protein
MDILIILAPFAFFVILILVFKRKLWDLFDNLLNREKPYDSYVKSRSIFFEMIPRNEIFSEEDCLLLNQRIQESNAKRKKTDQSDIHLEEMRIRATHDVRNMFLHGIIKEKARENTEVQYQLRVFLEKAIMTLGQFDVKKDRRATNADAFKEELPIILNNYGNDETKSLFLKRLPR